METTRAAGGRGKTTHAPSHPPAQTPATVAGRGSRTASTSTSTTPPPVEVSTSSTPQVPARESLRDAAPPTPTPVTGRPVRLGHTVAALPLAPVPVARDVKASLPKAPLTGDTARALLKPELPLHLVGTPVKDACKTVYDLCLREKLDPPCIQRLTRTMLEEHAPSALRGANAALNLMGYIVSIQPDNREWFTGSYREVLVHMLVGVAQAMARPGEPALSDAFLAQAALALAVAGKSLLKDGKSSHPDGAYFQLDLIRQFSIDVLSQLPPGSTAAFLHPLRKLDWLMKDVLDQSAFLINHMLLKVTAGLAAPSATVHHEHLDRVADHVMSLGLSLVDAGVQLTPCMSAWGPWLPNETPRVTYRLGILERMSGRPTLPPKRAGEVVLATLLRDAILATREGEALVWQYPAFGSLARFESLAHIHRASLLVPGLPSAQQARLLPLALMASDRQRGADEFRAAMQQLVVDLALHANDLEALALMACAFVRGGGAADTKSLERAVNLAPDAGSKKAESNAQAQPPVMASSRWIDDLRRALEPARREDHDVEMEASTSTTTTSAQPTAASSSSSRVDTMPARSSRELVLALQRGGALASNPLQALTMEDLDGPQRLALFDGGLAICAPLATADARALVDHLVKVPCTDTFKAQALQCLLRHAEPDFAADGQKALWGLLAQPPREPAAPMEDDAPPIETKASRRKPAGKPAGKPPGLPPARQFLFAKDTPLDVLKVAFQVVVEDGNRAWDAVVKARKLPLAHDRRHLVARLDATLARLAAAVDGAKKSTDPRAQQLQDEAQERIKVLSQARREFADSGNLPTSSSSSSSSS